MIDEILETIAEKIKSIGLDPLPIPDIDLPFSMDNVKKVYLKIFLNSFLDWTHHSVISRCEARNIAGSSSSSSETFVWRMQ